MDLIINFKPTGMIPTKEMTPNVPIKAEEIIDDIYQAGHGKYGRTYDKNAC